MNRAHQTQNDSPTKLGIASKVGGVGGIGRGVSVIALMAAKCGDIGMP